MSKEVTDDSFDTEVINATGPVLVDFWAEWCGPCKMIAPVVDKLAEQYDGRVQFAKVDVDANPPTPGSFGIRGIPTLLVFAGDCIRVVAPLSGVHCEDMVKRVIWEAHIWCRLTLPVLHG